MNWDCMREAKRCFMNTFLYSYIHVYLYLKVSHSSSILSKPDLYLLSGMVADSAAVFDKNLDALCSCKLALILLSKLP